MYKERRDYIMFVLQANRGRRLKALPNLQRFLYNFLLQLALNYFLKDSVTFIV